jgi:beta-carotene ketolase (CrtO type)
MADKSFDAIIIGGGNKGLVTALYLAKYGGMEVGVFEKRHELGGGWSSEEAPAPGFISDTHSTTIGGFYQKVLNWDFPDFEEKGGQWVPYIVAQGAIFREDHTCVTIYGEKEDPTQEKTAQHLARISEHDADAWLQLWKKWKDIIEPAFLKWVFNPPCPPGVTDAMDKVIFNPEVGIDPIWMVKSPLEVLRDLFDSDELICCLLRCAQSWHGVSPDMPAMGLAQIMASLALVDFGCAVGGTHSYAHAAHKIFLENGGKSFTKHEVEKVIFENGKAKGIRLTNGSEITARKLIVSTLDPYSLCFRLIGEEYLSRQMRQRVKFLSRKGLTITWYQWAVHELPQYRAAAFDSDINLCGHLALINKDTYELVREDAWMKLGKMPPTIAPLAWHHTLIDKTRAPEGKHVIGTEQIVLSADQLTQKEWRTFKKSHAEDLMRHWEQYAPNMTWDNVIGHVPLTPFDYCHLGNMAPEGNIVVIDNIPSQLARFRPIPELARHKTPIENLYATGVAWHHSGMASACQGYNCYKIIADDFALGKPWEKQGRPF